MADCGPCGPQHSFFVVFGSYIAFRLGVEAVPTVHKNVHLRHLYLLTKFHLEMSHKFNASVIKGTLNPAVESLRILETIANSAKTGSGPALSYSRPWETKARPSSDHRTAYRLNHISCFHSLSNLRPLGHCFMFGAFPTKKLAVTSGAAAPFVASENNSMA